MKRFLKDAPGQDSLVSGGYDPAQNREIRRCVAVQVGGSARLGDSAMCVLLAWAAQHDRAVWRRRRVVQLTQCSQGAIDGPWAGS